MQILISEHFGLGKTQDDLDFFDADLSNDTPAYIDPILIKRSPIEKERTLYSRYGRFFERISELLLKARLNPHDEYLKNIVTFHEPDFIHLGLTAKGTSGNGPGSSFGENLLAFLSGHMASRLIRSELKRGDFNPNLIRFFARGLGPDGIGDFSAGLIMDYLINYTKEQCRIHGIPTKTLGYYGAFDIDEFEWYEAYDELPENPYQVGKPIVFVPKRMLKEMEFPFTGKILSNIVGLIKSNDSLSYKFATIAEGTLNEIDIEDIKSALLSDEDLMKGLVNYVESETYKEYDFSEDFLNFTTSLKYRNIVNNEHLEVRKINNKEEFDKVIDNFLEFLKLEFTVRDGWRNAWENSGKKPLKEVSFGRIIRFIGNAYFEHYPNIHFLAEQGSYGGFLDFSVIFDDIHVSIEVKNLANSSLSGKERIPAYKHGIIRQLPRYVHKNKSNHAIYITLQHFNEDAPRIQELEEIRNDLEKEWSTSYRNFETLRYMNLDLTSKPSPSEA